MNKETSLGELELSIRAYNCLRNEGLKTVGDVLAWDAEALLRIPNFGRKSLNELNELLAAYGMRLAGRAKCYVSTTVSQDVLAKLKERASTNARSLDSEVAAILADAVGGDRPLTSISDRIDNLERLLLQHLCNT